MAPIAASALLILAVAGSGCGGDDSEGGSAADSGPETGADTGTPIDSGVGIDTGTATDSSTSIDAGTEAPSDATSEAPSDATSEAATADTGVEGGATDNGTFATVRAIANGAQFVSPFDATPDPTGTIVYFTAAAPDGNMGVFSAAATDGGTPTALFKGSPFVSPFGIAITSDGQTLFVADLGADSGTDQGAIYSVPVTGATPTLVAGTDGVVPRSLEIVGTKIYFTGTDKTDGKPGVFSMPVTGGTISVVAKGAPFIDPSGVTADAAGNVYVVDTIATSSQHGIVFKIASGGGTPAALGASVTVGYPAGLALSGDGTALLASSLTATGTDQILHIDTTSGAATSQSDGVFASGSEAAGLHRAHAAFAYAWVDSSAGATGTIYLLTK